MKASIPRRGQRRSEKVGQTRATTCPGSRRRRAAGAVGKEVPEFLVVTSKGHRVAREVLQSSPQQESGHQKRRQKKT